MTKIKTLCIPHKIRIPLREGPSEGGGWAYGQQQLLFTYLMQLDQFQFPIPIAFIPEGNVFVCLDNNNNNCIFDVVFLCASSIESIHNL